MATQGRYLPDWTIGKLTLEAESLEFTTTDSLLVTAEIQPGDTIITASGLTLPIAEITGENAGKLAYPCPAAAAGIDQPLRIRYQSEASRYTGMAASLFKMLGGGNLFSLGELQGHEGEYLRFLAPGVLEAVAGGNLDALNELDNVDNLGALAALKFIKNKLLGVDNDGKLAIMPLQKSVNYDAAQELTAAERGQAIANIGGSALSGIRDVVINGNFDIWQRYRGADIGQGFLADKWNSFITAGTGGFAQNRYELTSADKVIVGSGTRFGANIYASSDVSFVTVHNIEDARTYAGELVTLTFFIASTVSTPLTVRLVQDFGTGGTPSAGVYVDLELSTNQITPGFKKVTALATVPSVAGKIFGTNNNSNLVIQIFSPGGVTRNVYLTKVSLVPGDATMEEDPAPPLPIPLQSEFCQRYYQEIETGGAWLVGTTATGDLKIRQTAWLPTYMRLPPSITRVNAAGSVFYNMGWLDVSVTANAINNKAVQLIWDVPNWRATADSPGFICRLTNNNETLPVRFQLSSD